MMQEPLRFACIRGREYTTARAEGRPKEVAFVVPVSDRRKVLLNYRIVDISICQDSEVAPGRGSDRLWLCYLEPIKENCTIDYRKPSLPKCVILIKVSPKQICFRVGGCFISKARH